MTSLRRFTQSIVPFLVLGSCAELIGLSDYETGEAEESDAGQSTGGRSGTTGMGGTLDLGGKPSIGGEDSGGDETGGSTGAVGGRPPPRGGTSGDGGMGGEPEGGTGGKGGANPTGGSPPTGGAGMSTGGAGGAGNGNGGTGNGGAGGSPPCTEITVSTYVGQLVDDSVLPALALYDFDILPELGTALIDTFEIQFWDSQGSGSYDGGLTGSFMLGPPGADANYAFCSRCLVAYQDQGSATREKIFFQTEGTLIVAMDSVHMEGYPNFTVNDVTLREVIIDTDQISTVVPGGECLHITSAAHRIPYPNDWTCNIAWYTDIDCDCGCGQLDPTCTSSGATACRYCWCNDTFGMCSANEVESNANWQCR